MKGQGHQIFVDELTRFAAGQADARVTAIAERAAAPLRVAVRGRRGVGRGTVAGALDRVYAAGITLHPSARATGKDVDVVVYVTAEVIKPEDADAIAAARQPLLAVLNKADLAGSLSGRGGDGPIAAARTRCAELSELVRVPVEPMIGLLALDGLDDESWGALQVLAAHPGGIDSLDGSYDGFLAAENPLPAEARRQLLDTLDLFGTALGIAAIRQGRTQVQVAALLRRISGVDNVVSKVTSLGAEVRYQRVLDAVAELEALAASRSEVGERISGFLSHDGTVVARMAAAVDLAEASGLDVGRCDEPAEHLPRAARWQRYSRGSVSELHRACGVDIARGSLRLWSQTCGSLPEPHAESW